MDLEPYLSGDLESGGLESGGLESGDLESGSLESGGLESRVLHHRFWIWCRELSSRGLESGGLWGSRIQGSTPPILDLEPYMPVLKKKYRGPLFRFAPFV